MYFCHYTNQKGKVYFQQKKQRMFQIFKGNFQTLAIWTNIKAKPAGAGPVGYCYLDFVEFTGVEKRLYLSMYILNGLLSSPGLEMKFNTQAVD